MLLNVLKGKIAPRPGSAGRARRRRLHHRGHRACPRGGHLGVSKKAQVVDIDNGNRFETYVIAGEPGSGMICVNGAAAHCVEPGHKVIIMCYAQMTPEEFADPDNAPRVVFVDDDNRIARVTRYEKHGRLEDMQ